MNNNITLTYKVLIKFTLLNTLLKQVKQWLTHVIHALAYCYSDSYNDLSLVLLEELNIINNIQVLVNDAERDSWVWPLY